MVGVAHHHAVQVCQLLVFAAGAVQREGGGPHGGPEVIALHAQQEFKNAVVAPGVDAAVVPGGPGAEAGPFVVDEKAPVSDAWLLGHGFNIRPHRHVFPPQRGGVAEEAQRAAPQVFRQGEHAVDRPPLVAAADDQGALPVQAGQRDLIDLPLSRDIAPEHALGGQLLHQAAALQGAAEDYRGVAQRPPHSGGVAGDGLNVPCQRIGNAPHAGKIRRVNIDVLAAIQP